jgi:hypothetical protein
VTRKSKIHVSSKLLFFALLIVSGLMILFVWLFNLGEHKTLFENTFTSTWIISTVLFQFLFFGLYHGFKMKEDLGKIVEKQKYLDVSSDLGYYFNGSISEIEAVFVAILAIPLAIALIINFAIFFWASILIFIAIFYWIFYRAIKFAFKQSSVCHNNLTKSLLYSFGFTLMYTLWFFAIILGVHYFR